MFGIQHRMRFSASRVWRCNPLITSHSPCTTAEDGRCQSLAISDGARGRKMK